MRFMQRSTAVRTILYALAALDGVAIATTGLRAETAGLRDAPAGPRIQVATAVGPGPIKPLQPLVPAAEMDALLLSPVLTMLGPPVRSPAPTMPIAPRPRPAAHATPASTDITGNLSRTVAPAPTHHAQEPRAADPARPGSTLRVASIKRALKLRPEQEQYWLPVEAILRDIERQQRLAAGHDRGVRPAATELVSSAIDPENLQRLTSAAFPLIMSLDEAQKREARALAHSLGLENVASAI
jgi:hypothetical protein